MAEVNYVLEVITRGLNQYHSLRDFPVRLGRALDNDIILSDLTVSSHHLEIDLDENNGLILKNLSSENGTKINRQLMREDTTTVRLEHEPLNLNIGGRRMRLLRSDMDVVGTTVQQCSGFYMLFCNPVWPVLLMMCTLLVIFMDEYLQTIYDKEVFYYFSEVQLYVVIIIALTLIVAGISRLATQRWEVGAALSLVALVMMAPGVLGEVGHKLNYFFTAEWPLISLIIFSAFILLPLLLYTYIRFVHHSEKRPALGLALLLSAPFMAFQASDVADRMALAAEFTGQADFSRTLSSLDVRLAPTLTIDQFIDEANEAFSGDDKGLPDNDQDKSPK